MTKPIKRDKEINKAYKKVVDGVLKFKKHIEKTYIIKDDRKPDRKGRLD